MMKLNNVFTQAALRHYRKITAVFLIALFSLTIAYPAPRPALAYDPGSGILDAGKSKDIFLNVDAAMLDELRIQTGNPSLSIEDIAADLKAQLISLDPGAYNEVNIRIQYNETQIDTTDLSIWYVYDHYDTGAGVGEYRPYAKGDPIFNDMRVYYPVSDGISVAWPTTGTITYYNNTSMLPPWTWTNATTRYPTTGVYTIEQLLSFGTEAGMVKNGSLAGNYLDASGNPTGAKYPNARRLKEHIYSGADDSGAFMYFMGYGSSGVSVAGDHTRANNGNFKTDFLFYPAQESGRKKIEFQINSADVRTHSMLGAGFLLNTSIYKADGNPANNQIRGYVLFIEFLPAGSDNAPTGAKIDLYKIKDGTKVDDFHTRWENTSVSNYWNVTRYLELVASAMNNGAIFGGTGSLPVVPFKSTLDFTIEFDDTGLSVLVDDPTSLDPPAYVAFDPAKGVNADGFFKVNTGISTGAYGFGPLVDFGYSSHSCSTVSAYKFSNLKMTMETDVFKELRESQYFNAQNVDRYFINLSTEAIDPEAAPDFWDGIARLRTDKIFYVSNHDDGVVGPGGANGDNGKTLAKTAYNEMIAEMAAYIHSSGTAGWNDEALPELKITVPVAISSVIGWDDHTIESGEGEKPLFRIERAMTDANPVTVALHDRSTISTAEDPEAKITHLEIVAYDPDGDELYRETVEVNETGVYELFTLNTEHSTLGTYTVEMTAIYMDSDGKTEISRSPNKSVNTFELIEDICWPQVFLDDKIKISGDDTSADFLIGGRTAALDGSVYRITEGVYEGNDLILHLTDNHREPQHDDWGVQAYLISDPLYPDKYNTVETVLSDLWPDYLLTLNDLGAGERDITVTVWDWVGHETVYTLTVNPRINALTVTIDAIPGFLGDGDDSWDDALEEFRTLFDKPLIMGESVDVSDVSEFPLINGYELIGFTTVPGGTEPMTSITIESENTVLYPIFVDVTPPVIDFGDIFSSGYIGGNIKIFDANRLKSKITDNNATPLTADDVVWYLLEYDPDDDRDIEVIIAEEDLFAYTLNGDGEIDLSSLGLDPDKKYILYVEATDAEKNTARKATDPFQYDERIPAFVIGGDADNTGSDAVTRYSTTFLTFAGEGGVADPENLILTYSVDGGPPVVVDGLDDYILTLVPPATGETVYEIMVTDPSGRAIRKTIVVKAPGSVLDDIEGVSLDNVTSVDENDILDLIDLIAGFLQDDGTGGMTPGERAILEEKLDELEALTQKILDIKTAIEDVTDEIDGFKARRLSSGDISALRALDDKAEALLSAFDGNLTQSEKTRIKQYRSDIDSAIRSLRQSSDTDGGEIFFGSSGSTTSSQPEAAPTAARSASTLVDIEPMEEPLEDYDDAVASSAQSAEGGRSLDVPPIPHIQGDAVVQIDETHYVEFDEFGVPLGEWYWDEELGLWFFDEHPPMGILPQTGIAGLPLTFWLLNGLALAAVWFMHRARKKTSCASGLTSHTRR